MSDRIIIKNTTSEANLGNIQPEDVLNGEMLLLRETDKESLYCKNTNNEISKIHRITNCGGFPSSIVYEAVDLGLPSGLLWANKNIGASTEEDAGLYFQWGDTQGYTAEQIGVDKQFNSNWTDYKWGIDSNFTKYNSTDGLVILETADDAASQIMGSDWKMPTMKDFQELVSNTDIYFISTDDSEVQATYRGDVNDRFTFPMQDTMKGMKFYNKSDHFKYIFISASGYVIDGSIQSNLVYCKLWSSSFYENNVGYAWRFYFGAPGGSGNVLNDNRYYGFPIRAVKSQQ